MAKDLLSATDVSMVFGGLKAVADFNMHIKYGELIGLIGPNGAGKTTAFNLLTGVYRPTTGEILFKDKSIVGLAPYEITARRYCASDAIVRRRRSSRRRHCAC